MCLFPLAANEPQLSPSIFTAWTAYLFHFSQWEIVILIKKRIEMCLVAFVFFFHVEQEGIGVNKDCASEIRCRVSFAVLSVSSAVSVLPRLLWELTITISPPPPSFFLCRWICRISKYESCCQVPVLNAIFPHLARENSRKFQCIYSLFYLTWTKGIEDFGVTVTAPSCAPSQAEKFKNSF